MAVDKLVTAGLYPVSDTPLIILGLAVLNLFGFGYWTITLTSIGVAIFIATVHTGPTRAAIVILITRTTITMALCNQLMGYRYRNSHCCLLQGRYH